MKIIVSPAKSLNTQQPIPNWVTPTECEFLNKTERLHKILKTKTPTQLATLMDISDKLAQLNWQRYQTWQLPLVNARPAIYTFDGDVYDGLDIYTMPPEKLPYLQENVRILSGFYGLLKPTDAILPYRLEMGTHLRVGTSENLYQFWKNTLTQHLKKQLKPNEILVNLASKEYFDSIDTKKLGHTVLTPEFKDYKNGNYKTISFYAKKARGLMTRFAIDNQIEKVSDLKAFTSEGYAFDQNLSTETRWVFTR